MNRHLPANMNAQPKLVVAKAKQRARSFIYFFPASVLFTLFISVTSFVNAQSTGTEQQKADYQKAIAERSAKIVNTLSISDSVKYKKVQATIASQYFSLSAVQDRHTADIADIKKQALEKDKQADAIKTLEEKKSATLTQLHTDFIAHLK
ncbi:MAG: DUF3826 domain-containing protein, partial [Bacteroidota bacterium]